MKKKKAQGRIPTTLVIVGALIAVIAIVVTINHRPPATAIIEPPMLVLINQVRADAGKPPVYEDQKLDLAAQGKVSDQVNRNYWAHKPPTGESVFVYLEQQYPQHSIVGENLDKCRFSHATEVTAWHYSPEHYAIMTGDYNAMGWAEEKNPKDHNCTYAVMYFAKLK